MNNTDLGITLPVSRCAPPACAFEMDALIAYTKAVVALDTALEKMKQDIALCSDFNITDALQLFDIDATGQVDMR